MYLEQERHIVGRNPANQLKLVVSPSIYKNLYIPGRAGFLPSTVSHIIMTYTCENQPRKKESPFGTIIFRFHVRRCKMLENAFIPDFKGSSTNAQTLSSRPAEKKQRNQQCNTNKYHNQAIPSQAKLACRDFFTSPCSSAQTALVMQRAQPGERGGTPGRYGNPLPLMHSATVQPLHLPTPPGKTG